MYLDHRGDHFNKISQNQIGIMAENAKKDSQSTGGGRTKVATVESRFGELTVNLDNAIFFPYGLLGMEKNLSFSLTDMPNKSLGNCKVLQCLNDPSISFVVLPLGLKNDFIEKEDLEKACETLNISPDNLAVMVILSVQRTPEGVTVHGNLRAPVLIDTKDQAGIQYVFPNNKYKVSQQLMG